MTTPLVIEHDSRHAPVHRFVTRVDGDEAFAEYERVGAVMKMTHTVVAPALEGRGIAGQLVAAAFAHAKAHGLRIQPVCSYVRGYIQRHPETAPLLA